MSFPLRARHAEALVMLLLANFLWGLSFPLIKALGLLQEQLLPGTTSWFSALYTVTPRFVIGTLALVLWQARSFWKITRAEWTQGLLLGLFSSAGMLLQNDALHFTAASTSAFLTQLYAILIPVTLALRHRRNPGATVWVSCLLVLAGVSMLGRFDWQTMRFGRGEAETMLSSCFFMGQILCLGWDRFAGNRARKITLVMFAFQAVVFSGGILALAPTAHALTAPWASLPWLGMTLILTVFCTLGAYSLMNAWQPKITTTEAGLVYCMEPIFASLMALFLPALFSVWAEIHYANETATWTLLVGGALITGANILIQLRPPGASPA